HYWGQLTDPLSHALFVLALSYVVHDQPVLLGLSLGLGILAKETVCLVVPAYLACYWKTRRQAVLPTLLLGGLCCVAFLAVRLPLGWQPGLWELNATPGLMIWSNLGIPDAIPPTGLPRYQNYLHPAIFVGTFLPFIAARWRQIDYRLRAIFLVLVPSLL